MRVYEVAKELGVPAKELINYLEQSGFVVKSHMAVLDEAAVKVVRERYDKKHVFKVHEEPAVLKHAPKVEEASRADVATHQNPTGQQQELSKKVMPEGEQKKMVETVVTKSSNDNVSKRPSFAGANHRSATKNKTFSANRSSNKNHGASRATAFVSAPVVVNVAKVTAAVVDKLLTTSQLAELFGVGLNEVIVFFLKLNKVYSLNKIVPDEDIALLAKHLGIDVKFVKNELQASMQGANLLHEMRAEAGKGEPRAPVVVVMGHVDHGKTTLIDFIRKTKVVEGEKGRITQSINAYEVKTASGKLIVIDTPGHEAFGSMRDKGARITDIALIVVAADDGVMPQTSESIRLAKQMGATIVVALNKIDKDGVLANVDNIKQQLAANDVLVEDWGGDVVCVPISAKTGQGVDELLEMIALQSEVLGLMAKPNVPAEVFVLEAYQEKGLGMVASVLVVNGTLRVGDTVASGNNYGRIKAVLDAHGRNKKEVGPSTPARLVGLGGLVRSGDVVKVVEKHELERVKAVVDSASNVSRPMLGVLKDNLTGLKLVVKADSHGTLDALEKALELLEKRNAKLHGHYKIVAAGIGNIYEKDVQTAVDFGASILAMNVVPEKNAIAMIKEHGVVVRTEQIIYRLTDYVENFVLEQLKAIKNFKQVGEAKVLKVFDLKSKGVVAGCIISEGFFVHGAKVACMRKGKKLYEGIITSLQQDRRIVQQVNTDLECGFVCQGISDWQVGDKAVCFVEIPS